MRTFAASDWEAAAAAWTAADLGSEWLEVRRRAALRGILWPPNGTRWDSWEADHPSQLATVIRAIRETPELLLRSVDESASWGEVIGRLIAIRDEWQAEQRRRAWLEDRAWAAAKARDRDEASATLARLGATLAAAPS
jgi:hypothetical protein